MRSYYISVTNLLCCADCLLLGVFASYGSDETNGTYKHFLHCCSFSAPSGHWRGVGWEVDGVEGLGAAEADGGVIFFFAYIGDVAPAAFAFGIVVRSDFDANGPRSLI